ncbi:MAG: hypothetical protein KGQ93_15160 [Cyanobacteria bacterium REEB459]|nr:hypothetical protein [Cyanobacteria bacterium REEB459]
MSIAHRLSEKLEQPDVQARLLPLTTAQSLAGMVLVALEIGLMMARWVLENELARRAEAPQVWPHCPHCGSRLQSKGFQSRQMETLVGAIA